MVSIVSPKGGRAAAGSQVYELPCANRADLSTMRASRAFRARACPPPAMLEDPHIWHGHATRLIPEFSFLILRVGTLLFSSHHSGAAEKRTGQDIFVDWQPVDLAPCARGIWSVFFLRAPGVGSLALRIVFLEYPFSHLFFEIVRL